MFEDIDTTIQSVERLYRSVSGKDANGAAEPAPLPVEKDATKHVEEQVDRLLASLAMVPASAPRVAQAPAWAPGVCVVEQAAHLVICVDLPGLSREQVTITATPYSLIVSGRRALPEGTLRAVEVPFGAFRREIPLPPGTVTAELSAALKDGVLELRIPRAAKPAAGQPISIQ